MSRYNHYAEHIKQGRSLAGRLATAQRHFLEMSEYWGELDTCIMTALEREADHIKELLQELQEMMIEWKRGPEWED